MLISWKLITCCSVYSSDAQRPASLAPASLGHSYHLLLLFTPPAAVAAVTPDQHESANCYIMWAIRVFESHFCYLYFGGCATILFSNGLQLDKQWCT